MASRVNPPKETGVAISIILLAPNVVSPRFGNAASTSVPLRGIAARGTGLPAPQASMSAIGRIPAMGSFENGNAIATAPISFPSM